MLMLVAQTLPLRWRAVNPVPTGGQRFALSIGRSARLADPEAGNLLTMARSGSHVLGAPRLALAVPATVLNVTALRRTFRQWVGSHIEEDAAEDLTLAVYEALANAAEHAFAAARTPGSVWLHAAVADREISVTIADNGTWRRPTESGGYRGRGLPLIHQLTTEAHVVPGAHGTTVRLRRHISAEQWIGSAE